jgi:hypothetical protein
MEKNSSDWAFYLLLAVCRCLGMNDDILFFLLIATIQLLCMIHTFRRYSGNYWICIFLFVASTDYFSWMFNGMRQFIAVTMIFGATGLLLRRKYAAYTAVVLLAAQIHGSAILMLPLAYVMAGPAMNKKTILMIVGVAAVMPFIDRLMPMANELLADTQYSTTMTDEVWSVDDGTNPIRVLVYSVPALVALFGRKYIIRENNPVMNLCVNASMITTAIYLVSMVTSGIYRCMFLRLPYRHYFSEIALTKKLLKSVFLKKRISRVFCSVCAHHSAIAFLQSILSALPLMGFLSAQPRCSKYPHGPFCLFSSVGHHQSQSGRSRSLPLLVSTRVFPGRSSAY